MGIRRFALTGAAGYVAPRHMKAISETGNALVAVLDPHDSVGILDSYSPNARFFTEPERFDRHLEKLKRKGEDHRVHYMSICSPNYLHDAHIRIALRVGADAICEKPLVLNPWNVDALHQLEEETGKHIYCTLQLRYHPSILSLREREKTAGASGKRAIDLTYITSRGAWYLHSWKGDIQRSGGLASNIGVHFFDMLIWIYGGVRDYSVHLDERTRTSGYLELERAHVRWYLSIDPSDLLAIGRPESRTFRSIVIDGEEMDFTGGFENLHTEAYARILSGRGVTAAQCRPVIQLLHDIRESDVTDSSSPTHPLVSSGALGT